MKIPQSLIDAPASEHYALAMVLLRELPKPDRFRAIEELGRTLNIQACPESEAVHIGTFTREREELDVPTFTRERGPSDHILRDENGGVARPPRGTIVKLTGSEVGYERLYASERRRIDWGRVGALAFLFLASAAVLFCVVSRVWVAWRYGL